MCANTAASIEALFQSAFHPKLEKDKRVARGLSSNGTENPHKGFCAGLRLRLIKTGGAWVAQRSELASGETDTGMQGGGMLTDQARTLSRVIHDQRGLLSQYVNPETPRRCRRFLFHTKKHCSSTAPASTCPAT